MPILEKNLLWKVLLLVPLCYLLFCLLLYWGQRRLIYLPSAALHPLPDGFVEWLSAEGRHWGFKRTGAGTNTCLFFFHGNGGNARGWSHHAAEFPGDVFVLEYPGYGAREGKPTEAGIKEAALAGFEAEQARYQTVIVAGQSLGAAVTQAVFVRHPGQIARLVLITPFTSILDMARSQYPWVPTKWLLQDRMALFEEWKAFPGNSWVLLAGRDEVIPAAQAE